MRRSVFVFFILFIIAGLSEDSFSRSRSSSSSFSRSSSRSSSSQRKSSFSSSRKSTPSRKSAGTSTFSKNKTVTQKTSNTQKKAVAPSKISKTIAKKNASATQKYGKGAAGRKAATTDYRKERASQIKKQWDKEPTQRPNYVPKTINSNGRQVDVVFHNGGYGYYMGGAWTPLDYAAHMLVTDAMLMHQGYGYYGSYANYHPQTIITDPEAQRINAGTQRIVMFFFIGLFILILVIIGFKIFQS